MIDSHQHFWRYDPAGHDWINDDMAVLRRDFLPDDLEPLLELNGIHGCVAVQAAQTNAETKFLLRLAEDYAFINGVVGWVDLKSPDLSSQLAALTSSPKLKGVRHIIQSEPKGFMLQDTFVNGVRLLAEWNLTYDLLIYHHQLKESLQFLARTTDVKIVIDHLAKPSIRTREKTKWELDLAAAASFKNVFCKLSGLVTEAVWSSWTKEEIFPYLDEAFEIFGAERLMYGSDWPVCVLAASYEAQLEIIRSYIDQLSPGEKSMVMGGNAKRFYNL